MSAVRHRLARGAPGLQGATLLVGLAGVGLCAVGAAADMTAFLRAYLIGLVTWIDLPLGCLLLLLTYHLTGGGWGLALGGPMEAAVRTLPLLALLFVPVLLDLEIVFPWARHAFLTEHAAVGKKAAYLDATFFTARAAVYWVTWVALAFALTSPHRGGALAERPRSKGLAAAGAILYALSASFAAVDWIVSLEPTFYSSAFGMLAMSG